MARFAPPAIVDSGRPPSGRGLCPVAILTLGPAFQALNCLGRVGPAALVPVTLVESKALVALARFGVLYLIMIMARASKTPAVMHCRLQIIS